MKKEIPPRKLPNALTIALGRYYVGRALQHTVQTHFRTAEGVSYRQYEVTPGKPWDKSAALQVITDALPKGWGFSASAGTFWFSTPRGNVRTVNETSWPYYEQ